MAGLEHWLIQRGPTIARALDDRREPICAVVSSRLAMTFPTLCFDPARPDALAFQQRTFHETPRRFHRLIQVVLVLQTLEVITREYRWGWQVVSRYGVQQEHMLAQVRWYFEAAQSHITLSPTDRTQMHNLAAAVFQRVTHAIGEAPHPPSNGIAHK